MSPEPIGFSAIAFGILVGLAFPGTTDAQADGGKIGKWVVQRNSSFHLKIGKQNIEAKDFVTYRIGHVNGPWLWLSGGGAVGWAAGDQVVPVEQAIDFFTDYIRANPGDAFGFAARADHGASRRKSSTWPWPIATRLCESNPPSAVVYLSRGNIWYDKQENDKAIADFAEAIRIEPQFAAAYNRRAGAWHRKKDFHKAFADYNAAIRFDPANSRLFSNRGLVYLDNGEYDKGIVDLDEAIRIDPEYEEAYNLHRARLDR